MRRASTTARGYLQRVQRSAPDTALNPLGHSCFNRGDLGCPFLVAPNEMAHVVTRVGVAASAGLLFDPQLPVVGNRDIHRPHEAPPGPELSGALVRCRIPAARCLAQSAEKAAKVQ